MSYLRAYIPACEGYGWEGGPEFSTRIVRMASGRERRNAEWSQPQHFYAIPFANLTQTQYAPIKQMHLNRRGRWGCFLFRDRLDDYASNESFAVAESGQTEFQLSKWSVIDGVAYHNEINAIYLPGDDWTAEEVLDMAFWGAEEARRMAADACRGQATSFRRGVKHDCVAGRSLDTPSPRAVRSRLPRHPSRPCSFSSPSSTTPNSSTTFWRDSSNSASRVRPCWRPRGWAAC